MIDFDGRGIVLDIEGTMCPIAFVHEVLFPFARRWLDAFLRDRWDDPDVAQARQWIARDAGNASLADAPDRLRAEVVRLMDGDVKATGLKELQGLIWEEGFRAGILKSPVFADVPPALSAWRSAGIDLRIYSSGSVAAQRLVFAHTEVGDLSACFRGHFDTTLGPKRAPASYSAIAAEMHLEPAEVLFLSDVVEELDAARAAGLATALVVRPGNAPASPGPHASVTSFDQIITTRPA